MIIDVLEEVAWTWPALSRVSPTREHRDIILVCWWSYLGHGSERQGFVGGRRCPQAQTSFCYFTLFVIVLEFKKVIDIYLPSSQVLSLS